MSQVQTSPFFPDWQGAYKVYRAQIAQADVYERALLESDGVLTEAQQARYASQRDQASMVMGIATMRLFCGALAEAMPFAKEAKKILEIKTRVDQVSMTCAALAWGREQGAPHGHVLDSLDRDVSCLKETAVKELDAEGPVFLSKAIALLPTVSEADFQTCATLKKLANDLPLNTFFNATTFQILHATFGAKLPENKNDSAPVRGKTVLQKVLSFLHKDQS